MTLHQLARNKKLYVLARSHKGSKSKGDEILRRWKMLFLTLSNACQSSQYTTNWR